jgi:chemotaxis signal transduction protein
MSTAAAPAESFAESKRFADMRRAFDQSFATPHVGASESLERMIVIRLGGEPFAMRASHISGIARAKCIVSLPSRIPEVLGLAGIRGTLVPVFDLRSILKLKPCVSTPSWLALVVDQVPIALGFDEFDGQVELSPTNLYADESPTPRSHVQLLARIGPSVHPVIDIPSILEVIRKKADAHGQARDINP